MTPASAPSTSYSYRVRASDAAGNLSSYSNIAGASTPATATGLVAAYAFDEGSGTTVADASGNGHTGTIANTTWAASGKYGKALQFNGSNALVTVPDAASLHLSSGMTLEAWVIPSTVDGSWRDVIYKGNDNYYLEATSSSAGHPDAGMIAGGSYAEAYGTAALPASSWSFLAETYDGIDAAAVRQRQPGRLHRPHRHDRELDEPAADRRRQHLWAVLRRPDRRGPRLQRRPHRRRDPNRPRQPRNPAGTTDPAVAPGR